MSTDPGLYPTVGTIQPSKGTQNFPHVSGIPSMVLFKLLEGIKSDYLFLLSANYFIVNQ